MKKNIVAQLLSKRKKELFALITLVLFIILMFLAIPYHESIFFSDTAKRIYVAYPTQYAFNKFLSQDAMTKIYYLKLAVSKCIVCVLIGFAQYRFVMKLESEKLKRMSLNWLLFIYSYELILFVFSRVYVISFSNLFFLTVSFLIGFGLSKKIKFKNKIKK